MQKGFTIRDIVLMAVFAAVASSFFITTIPLRALIPFNMPGIYGILVLPFSTLFTFVGFGLVSKKWAATFTYFIFAVVSMIVPGGPGPLKLIFMLNGVVIDLYLSAINKKIYDARWVAATSALLPALLQAPLFWLGFKYFFGLTLPALPFILVFVGLHGVLVVVGGVAAFYILRRLHRLLARGRG